MSEFNLMSADKAQLKAYAKNDLDLNLPLTNGEDTMREKIIAECKKLNIEPPMARIEGKHGKKKGKYITINISKQSGPAGADAVFIGHQGKGYLVPRGIDVDVPEGVVGVLKTAVQDIVTQDRDTGEVLHEDVTACPFQIIGAAA